MSARGFKSVFMVGAIAGAALGCYLISLNVASERAALESVENRIAVVGSQSVGGQDCVNVADKIVNGRQGSGCVEIVIHRRLEIGERFCDKRGYGRVGAFGGTSNANYLSEKSHAYDV